MSIRKAYNTTSLYVPIQKSAPQPAGGGRTSAILGVGSVLLILAAVGIGIGYM
jgi:hypothetical protein